MRLIEQWFQMAALAIEALGVAVIILGALMSLAAFLARWRRAGDVAGPYQSFRAELGRAILLGLEFLVAADIIATVSADATLRGVAILAAIVLIRTFLSFTIEMEITGRSPWTREERER